MISHLFGKKLRKYVEFGDVGFGYIVWYGLTRLFMEPLRHSAFNMGENKDGVSGYWSWFWSIAMVVGGVLLIVGNHIVRNILRKKNNTFVVKSYDKNLGLISSLIILVIGVPLLVLGILNLNEGTFQPVMGYNQFNVGLMLLVLGVSALLCLGISVPIFINSLRGQTNE